MREYGIDQPKAKKAKDEKDQRLTPDKFIFAIMESCSLDHVVCTKCRY